MAESNSKNKNGKNNIDPINTLVRTYCDLTQVICKHTIVYLSDPQLGFELL
jgi:hypothetical protein